METDIYATKDKIQAIAELFSAEGMNDSRSLSVAASSGIYWILGECAKDLDAYVDKTEPQYRDNVDRENNLERFMKNMADRKAKEPEDWSFKAAAANIREQLSR